MHKSSKRFVLPGAQILIAALFAFPWSAAEAQQPPFPVVSSPAPLQTQEIQRPPPGYLPPQPQVPPTSQQFNLYRPPPQPPYQEIQRPPPGFVQLQPQAPPAPQQLNLNSPPPQPTNQPQSEAPGTGAAVQEDGRRLSLIKVLKIQRNLYLGFSPANYLEAGNVRVDYGLSVPAAYSLKEKLDLFTFRYALQPSEHSEILFGISHSQQHGLQIQPGKKVENTFTSLSVAAKEKLILSDKIALYGYLGFSYNEFSQNISISNTGDEPLTIPELDGLSPIYALGLELDLTEDLGVFLEFSRFYEQERNAHGRRPKALVEGFNLGLYLRL